MKIIKKELFSTTNYWDIEAELDDKTMVKATIMSMSALNMDTDGYELTILKSDRDLTDAEKENLEKELTAPKMRAIL